MAATLERSQWPRQELVSLLCGAFPESSVQGVTDLIGYMIHLGYLMETDGVLQIGLATEKHYGRAHYKDLLASFSGAQLLLGRFGNMEVGFIDPTMLTGDKEVRLILLAGKSWRIMDVDWKRQTVWLEPAKEGGKARWTGSGRTLSREIAQGIFRALHEDAGNHAVISKRARLEIEQVVEDTPDIVGTSGFTITRNETGGVRLWTFGGTRANRTIAKHIQTLTEVRRIDALGLDLKMPIDPKVLNTDFLVTDLHFSEDEVKERAKPIKFADCLPASLLVQIILTRQFE